MYFFHLSLVKGLSIYMIISTQYAKAKQLDKSAKHFEDDDDIILPKRNSATNIRNRNIHFNIWF